MFTALTCMSNTWFVSSSYFVFSLGRSSIFHCLNVIFLFP
jgi:hypothetical protein